MRYALARRDELNVANTTHDNALADIKSDTIHNIIHVITRLNKRGISCYVSFDRYSITIGVNTAEGHKFLESNGSISLSSAAELIDALQQLEDLENAAFIEDTLSTFKKDEVTNDAETV